jgi:apolipoprotein N-acyltransferase
MQKFVISLCLSFIAGGLYALAYPSFLGNGWLPLIFISFPLFLWQLEKASFKGSLLVILFFNLGLNLLGYYWIPHTLREFGELPYAVSIIMGAFFSLILQTHWWLYSIWRKIRPSWNWNSERNIILTAVIITLLERFTPQQFPSYAGSPWLHLAPYLGLAPYFGVIIFSFMTYWVSLEIVNQLKQRKLKPQVWIAFTLFIVINAAFPLSTSSSKDLLSVRIIQANIGNFLKISSEKGDAHSFEAVYKSYLDLSLKDNGFKPELIVWPETAYPHTFQGKDPKIDPIFHEIMEVSDAEMLIGGYVEVAGRSSNDFYESVFNSSILLSAGTVKTSYHKNILIPFGETLPFGTLNRQIVSFIPTISLFARGTGTPLMETKNGFRFVTPICYEILETNYMRMLLNEWGQNHFIVNHTNDSWYGDTAEPHQHLFLSKWRALEFKLPIIRSTNTGITSIIYPDGSESERLKINEIGVLDVKIPLVQSSATVYQTYGAFIFLFLAGLIYLTTWWREKSESQP